MEHELDIRLKQFDMLHSLLRDLQKGLMRSTFASAAFILFGIGWFATEDVAPFVRQHPHFILVAALAPIVGSALYSYGAWLVHKRSQNIVAALRRLDAMPSEVYKNTIVSRGQFFMFSAGIILLCILLGGCIYLAGHSTPEKDDSGEDEVIMQVVLRHTHEMKYESDAHKPSDGGNINMANTLFGIPAYAGSQSRRIRKLVTTNPKRKNSLAAIRFAKYRTGMTVEEYVKECEGIGKYNYAIFDITYDTDPKRNFIELY